MILDFHLADTRANLPLIGAVVEELHRHFTLLAHALDGLERTSVDLTPLIARISVPGLSLASGDRSRVTIIRPLTHRKQKCTVFSGEAGLDDILGLIEEVGVGVPTLDLREELRDCDISLGGRPIPSELGAERLEMLRHLFLRIVTVKSGMGRLTVALKDVHVLQELR
jgi:hypothetical protein